MINDTQKAFALNHREWIRAVVAFHLTEKSPNIEQEITFDINWFEMYIKGTMSEIREHIIKSAPKDIEPTEEDIELNIHRFISLNVWTALCEQFDLKTQDEMFNFIVAEVGIGINNWFQSKSNIHKMNASTLKIEPIYYMVDEENGYFEGVTVSFKGRVDED